LTRWPTTRVWSTRRDAILPTANSLALPLAPAAPHPTLAAAAPKHTRTCAMKRCLLVIMVVLPLGTHAAEALGRLSLPLGSCGLCADLRDRRGLPALRPLTQGYVVGRAWFRENRIQPRGAQK
jgi:hypothetical protein